VSWAALLLALAVIAGGTPGGTRHRVIPADRATGARTPPAEAAGDPLAVASSLDVLSACLSSGMTVAGAAGAAAASAPRSLAVVLHRAADLLALGAEPALAWSDSGVDDRRVAALLRLTRRSSASGAALAQGVAELADQSRLDAADMAKAAAERAAVLIAGPLGLCYLPAFVCLGIVPVVVGLAGDVLSTGVL
jgi:pilus assembly protein TadC